MSQTTVAVAVVNYNSLRHLEAYFESLLSQTYPAGWSNRSWSTII